MGRKLKRRRSKSRSTRAGVMLGLLAATIAVLAGALWWLTRTAEGPSTGNPEGDFGDTLMVLASRHGAGTGDVVADDPIRKVDGVFVRSWSVRLPSQRAVDALGRDLESEAAARHAVLTRVGGDGDDARWRVHLGVEAFDLSLSAPAARAPSPVRRTPPPTPTAAPTRRVPPADARGRLAILLDDGGQSLDLLAAAAALPPVVAVSVLPFLPHSADVAAEMHRSGHEVWLHLPMEPEGYPASNPGPGAILVSMTPDEIRVTVHSALNSVPHVVGVNNHMGSRATASLRTMTWVMQELKARDVAFIDSRTSVDTLAEEAARAQGVPTTRRHVFLDNERSRGAIRRQLEEAVYRCRLEGEILAIGHVAKVTIEVLEEDLPGLGRRGADLVPPTKLLR